MKSAELTRKIASRGAAALLVLTASFGALSSAPAATPDNSIPSVTVRYADLNLSTEAGARALYRRITFAAKQVCPADDIRNLSTLDKARACQQAAIEHAVRLIDNPQFAAVHAAAMRHG